LWPIIKAKQQAKENMKTILINFIRVSAAAVAGVAEWRQWREWQIVNEWKSKNKHKNA